MVDRTHLVEAMTVHAIHEGECPSCLVIDDHGVVRSALSSFLTGAGMVVAGEAACGDAAIELLATTPADVAVLDYRLPDMTAFDVAREVQGRAPGVILVLYSGELTAELAREAFDVGIQGVVLKAVPPTSLLTAIRAVLRGERYLDPSTPDLAPSFAVG
jgi:two-component system invasion response regulator UvrY